MKRISKSLNGKTQMTDPLVGKLFHSFKNGNIHWQGQIKAVVEPGYYLCQLFEWMLGSESCCEIVTVKNMAYGQFRFYDDEEHWRSEGSRLNRLAAEQAR